jgi:hypothetical protein
MQTKRSVSRSKVEETMFLWIIKNEEGKNVKARQQERSENRHTI